MISIFIYCWVFFAIYIVSCNRILRCQQGDVFQMPSELDIQMEIERLAVQDFSLEQQQLSSRSDLLIPTPPVSNESRTSSKTSDTRSSRKKTKLK